MKRNLLLSIIGCALCARVGIAQEIVPSKLKPADAVLTVPFNSAQTMQELRDGRVILDMTSAAPRRQYMGVADMKNGRVDSIPGFPMADMLALAADTSLLRVSGGWAFAKGTKVLGMLEATNPVVVAAQRLINADSMGFLVAFGETRGDSIDIVRVNRSAAEVEVLTRVKRAPGVRGGVPAPLYNGLKERVVYALDGWLGVLRIAPYRVDWRSPTGKWTLGKPIPLPVVKFDDREKVVYMVGQALLMGDTVPASASKIRTWPDVVEQVGLTADPIATPDGKMLVYRTATADYPMTRYDVVNREGVVQRQIAIGQRERIVAFGAKSVYVRVGLSIRTDVRLERHPWP